MSELTPEQVTHYEAFEKDPKNWDRSDGVRQALIAHYRAKSTRLESENAALRAKLEALSKVCHSRNHMTVCSLEHAIITILDGDAHE